ncbi:MAG: hypothetical protein WA628_01875 [Terriglobales bacterium]
MKTNTKTIIVIAAVLFVLLIGLRFSPSFHKPAPPQQAMNPFGSLTPQGAAIPDMTQIAGDQATVYQLMSQHGMEMDTATYLAQAKVQVLGQSNTSVHMLVTLPKGITSDTTITITPDVNYHPTAAELDQAARVGAHAYNVKFNFENLSDTKARMKLQYFVPYEAVPADLQRKIHGQSSAVPRFELIPSAWAQESGGGSGVGVIMETVLEIDKAMLNTMAEEEELAKHFPGPLSNLMVLLKAAKKGMDLSNWMDDLNEIQDCAENPTNKLTQNAYEKDPTYKEKVVDGVKQARNDAVASTAMRYLNLGVTTGIEKQNETLGVMISPISSWNDDTLKELVEQHIKDSGKNVAPCEDKRPAKRATIKYAYTRVVNVPGDTQDVEGTVEGSFEFRQDPYGHTVYYGEGEATLEWTETYTHYSSKKHEHLSGPLMVTANGRGSPEDATLTVNMNGENLTHTYACSGSCANRYSVIDTLNFIRTCEFNGVDLNRGGAYTVPGTDDGTGSKTTCQVKIPPD